MHAVHYPEEQHFFLSTWRTLLQRGHVWYASLKSFMKNGIRQQHRKSLEEKEYRMQMQVKVLDMDSASRLTGAAKEHPGPKGRGAPRKIKL